MLLIRDGFAAYKDKCDVMHLVEINGDYFEIQSTHRIEIFSIRKKAYEYWPGYEPRLKPGTSAIKYKLSSVILHSQESENRPCQLLQGILRVLSVPLPIILLISPVFTTYLKLYWRFSEAASLATLRSNKTQHIQ